MTRKSLSTEKSVDIQKLLNMKFLLLMFVVVVGKYCLAAGLDEVSDKISPRMDQMSGLRRMTQSKPLYSKGGFRFRHLKQMSTLILPCRFSTQLSIIHRNHSTYN